MTRLSKALAAVVTSFWFASAGSPVQQPLAIRTSKLLDLHRSLIEVQSISGSERDASDLLSNYLRSQGFTVETQDVIDNRQNVFAYLGDSRETRVLVTSHIDTVPPFWPYERRGDEIWGRGSVDAKGSVAAQIIAVEDLISRGKITVGDVALLFVVGEENSGVGMQTANDLGLSWEAVVFGEPTELKLASGHKGGLGFTIRAKGKAGHSGYPELGRNAIDVLVQGLAALQQLELPGSQEFGNTTVNVGRISGGVASNVIPDSAFATGLVRIAAEDSGKIASLIKDKISSVSPDLEVEIPHAKGPVAIDHDIKGFETIVVNYGTDIANLKGTHKRYLYGPGTILLAHSDHEHIPIKDLEAAVEGYKYIISELLD